MEKQEDLASNAGKVTVHNPVWNVREGKVPFEKPVYDVMGGMQRHFVVVDDQGDVSLMDVMPRLVCEGSTADSAIVQAARVSYGAGTKQVSDDQGLVRYLKRHNHCTPEEMVVFKFKIIAPIIVARQLHRHRAASINECSARYSEVEDRFYYPDEVKEQSTFNKQGSDGNVSECVENWFDFEIKKNSERSFENYQEALKMGVARETARLLLPVNMYTEWYLKVDLRNLFNMLQLRMDEHTQDVTRNYANAMYKLIKPIVPVSCKAFEDYQLGAMTLTALEIRAISSGSSKLDTTNKREQTEWDEKRKKLKLQFPETPTAETAPQNP